MDPIPHFELNRQHTKLAPALEEAYNRVLGKGWFVLGDEVKAFEHAFSEYHGLPHCVTCANGTDALEMALAVAGVGGGDEVVVPANTWVSVAEAAVRLGALPVFADTVPGEYTIDPSSVERCLSEKTKAVIVVHQFGLPVRLDGLQSLKAKHGFALIEDCAHAHGAEYQDKKVGTFGDMACFSFYPTKNLGCLGDGGGVITGDDGLAEKLRLLGNHGQVIRDDHRMVGRNSRLDELQAAFLMVKLKHLDRFNKRRRAIASAYRSGLDRSMYRVPAVSDTLFSVFHQFVIQTEDRERLLGHLAKHGVKTAIHYPSLIPDMPPYRSFRSDPEGLPVSTSEKDKVLSLPMFPELTDEEVQSVVHALNHFRG